MRELERLLGRKTMKNEILREALAKSQAKKRHCGRSRFRRRFAVRRIAEVLGVSRSNLAGRGSGSARPRGSHRKADDEDLLPLIRRFVDERPTYGYPHHGLGEPGTETKGLPVVNRKRVHRGSCSRLRYFWSATGRRERRVHDGR